MNIFAWRDVAFSESFFLFEDAGAGLPADGQYQAAVEASPPIIVDS